MQTLVQDFKFSLISKKVLGSSLSVLREAICGGYVINV